MRAGGLGRPAQRGFVLASAIFLLVIMAALAAFMVQVSVSSQTASALDVQGARAYQAARLGIEAGLYAIHVQNKATGDCPAASPLSNVDGLNGFTVNWRCEGPSSFNEGGVSSRIWQIKSTATYGVVSSADYVERELIATTEWRED